MLAKPESREKGPDGLSDSKEQPGFSAPEDYVSEMARIDWYRVPIDKETMRTLNERSDLKGFLQVVPQLAITVGAGAGVYWLAHNAHWAWLIPALFVYWTIFTFCGLSGAGHELCHNTPFKTKWLNEFFVRLYGFFTYTNFHHFRASHSGHHRYTLHDGLDLEVIVPLGLPRKRDWLYMLTWNPGGLIFTVKNLWRLGRGRLEGEWEHRIFPESEPQRRRQMSRWSMFMLFGHAVLAAVFIATGQWILLLLVTFAPFGAGWLNWLCGATQHTGMTPNVPDFRYSCRTFIGNPIVRFLYWNMNYHIEHHMYPGVPFYNLPKLHKAIAHESPRPYRGLIECWRHIPKLVRRQREDAAFSYVPVMPNPHPQGPPPTDAEPAQTVAMS